MRLSTRSIFQVNSLPTALTINTGPVDITAYPEIGPAMAMPYYVESPDYLNWTTSFDSAAINSGAFDGLGYCGSVTFKHKTQYDLVDVNGITWGNTFWNDPYVERPHTRDPLLYPSVYEYFMFDGVLKTANDPAQNTAVFTPITIARTKTTAPGPKTGLQRLAFTSEYMDFCSLWFDIEFDDSAITGRWLTLVWSHLPITSFTQWAPDSKYGPASGNAGIRLMLYDAKTGQLLGKTERQMWDTVAYMSLSLTQSTFVFDSRISEPQPGLDFELNNNCQNITGEMLRMSSVWWSLGSDCWDPLVVGTKAVGTNLPTYINGKRAIINMTVTEEDSNYVYGHRPGAVAQVTSPVNSNNIGALVAYDVNKAPVNDKP